MGRELREGASQLGAPRDEQGRYMPPPRHHPRGGARRLDGPEGTQGPGTPSLPGPTPGGPGVLYEEWGDQRPNPQYHRPAFQEEPTWYQVYENVTEGTPVTPSMPSLEDLEEHLVSSGTATREQAQAFIQRAAPRHSCCSTGPSTPASPSPGSPRGSIPAGDTRPENHGNQTGHTPNQRGRRPP